MWQWAAPPTLLLLPCFPRDGSGWPTLFPQRWQWAAYLVSPEVVVGGGGQLVALDGIDEREDGLDEAVGRHVVAVLRQQVVVDLGEQVERDAAVRRRHAVVRLAEQRVEVAHRQVALQQAVRQPVDGDQRLQLLRETRALATSRAKTDDVQRSGEARRNKIKGSLWPTVCRAQLGKNKIKWPALPY